MAPAVGAQGPLGPEQALYGSSSLPATGGRYAEPPASGNYASWGLRVLAALIDIGLVLAIELAAFSLAAILGLFSDPLSVLMFIVGYLAAFAFVIWQLVVQGRTGQTIGKGIIGVRLVFISTGRPVGAPMSIVRQLLGIVNALPCYLGYLWPIWDEKRQTFSDKIVQTVVIIARPQPD